MRGAVKGLQSKDAAFPCNRRHPRPRPFLGSMLHKPRSMGATTCQNICCQRECASVRVLECGSEEPRRKSQYPAHRKSISNLSRKCRCGVSASRLQQKFQQLWTIGAEQETPREIRESTAWWSAICCRTLHEMPDTMSMMKSSKR